MPEREPDCIDHKDISPRILLDTAARLNISSWAVLFGLLSAVVGGAFSLGRLGGSGNQIQGPRVALFSEFSGYYLQQDPPVGDLPGLPVRIETKRSFLLIFRESSDSRFSSIEVSLNQVFVDRDPSEDGVMWEPLLFYTSEWEFQEGDEINSAATSTPQSLQMSGRNVKRFGLGLETHGHLTEADQVLISKLRARLEKHEFGSVRYRKGDEGGVIESTLTLKGNGTDVELSPADFRRLVMF